MQPEKLDLTSATVSEEKLAQLRDLLPEVFHEGKINFDELKNALGEYVEDDPANERFGLRWPGKSKLQQVINTPSVGTLVPQPEESVDWDDTGNIIIEGDNLEVLKLLQKSYAGKVKMIYIDPPYNTGNDFVYPDKYASGLDTYLEFTGQTDDEGKKLASNSDTSGRYHANWLNMMYPRLYLARNLLRQDGVIFVSIDEHEITRLASITEEVFGEQNHIGTFVWQKKRGGSNDAKFMAVEHEFVTMAARSIDDLPPLFHPYSLDYAMRYKEEDDVGKFFWDTYLRKSGKQYYSVVAPDGTVIDKDQNGNPVSWLRSEERLKSDLEAGDARWLKKSDRTWSLQFKQRMPQGQKPRSLLTEHGTTSSGTDSAGALMPMNLFDNPKPVELIAHLSSFGSGNDNIVLDFFAGSGTTGHAVMQQNADDGGNRKYILVQLPEPMEPKTLDDGTELNTIADIARERVRRAGKKIREEQKGSGRDSSVSADGLNAQNDGTDTLDIGFRAYKLAPSNFQPWDGDNTDSSMMTTARQASFMPQTQQLTLEQRILQAADHLNPAADDLAILTELLLKLGEELTVPVEQLTLAGKMVYAIDGNVRLICLERNVTLDVIREMAAREPGEIICLDAGFADDQTKVNAGQIIATQAQHIEGAIAFKVV